MGTGGPVWHASARGPTPAISWWMAEQALEGVGDAGLYEHRQLGHGGIVHLRRRLTDQERAAAGGLEVRDVRGTPEEQERLEAVRAEVPAHLLPPR